MTDSFSAVGDLPVIIIGAGISGLLLAQQLRKLEIPFQIFEREKDVLTRGAGWGLTLHWSLPALRELLPEDLLEQLPDTYVDRAAVERGESSTFPFFDLSTGQKKSSSPKALESQRIRVTRERLRRLLATNIDIKWGKAFKSFEENQESVHAIFEDGTTCQGRLVVGCDGSHSGVRRALFPVEYATHLIPIRLFGFTLRVTAEQAEPIRALDPFFLQGTASASNTFMYLSLLEAPQKPENSGDGCVYQICISWNTNNRRDDAVPPVSLNNEERIQTIRKIANDWAEPFHSFVNLITSTTSVKQLDLDDYAPHTALHSGKRVVLVGDAFHAMTMYRGEGANHTIVDVLELVQKVIPHLGSKSEALVAAIDGFENGLVARTRSAVLASRKACLDAHDWHGLTKDSPLVTRREMYLDFDG